MQNFKDDSVGLDELEFIINHVFLPPKLPHEADEEETLASMNSALLNIVLKSAKKYQHELGGSTRNQQWTTAVNMLHNLYNLQGRSSSISKMELGATIRNMSSGDIIALHIAAQNAGIILQHLETEMLFVSFEASPTASAVMGTSGKLLCSYPGPAIAVPISKVMDPTFREEFSIFAEQMNHVVLQEAMPTSTKAGLIVVEERDTANPKFITEMLTGILRAIGRPVDNANRFQKRIADDVLWCNAKLPWRRSPLWLVVRVALRIALADRIQYKIFMIFFLADVLDVAVKSELSSDLLFIMNTKLSRRTYKLRYQVPQFVLDKASGVTTINCQALEDRWAKIQGFHSRALNWEPKDISLEKDTRLSLQNSKEYLAAVIDRKAVNPEPLPFNAVYEPRNPITGASRSLPSRNLMNTHEDERYILLADFEAWVQENLNEWTTNNVNREEACRELSGWIDDYTTTAKMAYQSNPESMSLMLLTTYELWVAMDRVVVNHYPLLFEYAPELVGSDKLFEPLLLPRRQQMERLHRVESYLQGRRARANQSNPSIFSSNPDSNCFAVRYFNQSQPHQELEKSIEGEAEKEKQRKVEEFNRKRREYDDYQSRASAQSCTSYTDYRGYYQHPYCSKCTNQQNANIMRIDVHEWPLPKDHFKRMVVVFELQCPMGFCIWRETTYKILVDICTATQPGGQSSEQPFEQLWDYSGLSRYFISQGQRLAWSSRTKSFLRSHYSNRGFPTSVDSICVDNALRYEFFDRGTSEWAMWCLGKSDLKKLCTFSLPEGPYRGLQYAVDGFKHTSNEVISNQHGCPIELSLHEYDSFGTLRAGHRLQWLNIVREIRSSTLTFSNEAVNALLMQAAWQAGPFDTSSIYRECHIDLEKLEFGQTLLGELGHMLTSIESNWLESTSAKPLIYLTARLLSMSKHNSITKDAFLLLRRARGVTLGWTRQLVKKLQECKTEANMRDLQFRVLEMAAICRATYDVDNQGDHLEGILNSAEDISILIECATIIHDNTPANTSSLPQTARNLLDRDRRLSHMLEAYLRNSKLQEKLREGLDQSIKQVYSSYIPGSSSWDSLPPPRDRWMVAKTGGGRPQILRYNLLSGQLLIDGSPVGRMPLNFVEHLTYQRLFGQEVLDVFPSSMPGMCYQARLEFSDPKPKDPNDLKNLKNPRLSHQVHFSMCGDELVIRTCVPESTEIYELVPHTKLSGDFATHSVEDYMHWINVETGEIEFRPTTHPWTITNRNWCMSYRNSLMYLGKERMLDIRSHTVSMIGSILSTLEKPSRIDITCVQKDGIVSARLPRLKLEFFLNSSGGLESRQFRGAVVDASQNIGTMSGLINRLVLRNGTVRSVIIPYGEVGYQGHENHIRVHICTEGLTRVQYYHYNIDSRLGRLVGNGSLTSHLYKIYLHAVTAHCLPDPLTSRTGTEEALDGLRSAATWSFQKLQSKEIYLLSLIASLTPARCYYPQDLEVMQTVHWNPIPPVMQHDEFHTIATGIFAHATQFHVFRNGDGDAEVPVYYKSKSDNKLLERAAVRNATYRKDEFGGSLSGTVEDILYVARDSLIDESKETQVCSVARAVESWSPNLDISRQLMGVLEEWKCIKGVTGERFRLGYDHRWINQNLADVWGSVYDACRQSEKNQSTYQLMFFLSTLAYSGHVQLQVIGTFLAFATNPRFRSLTPPQYPSYSLTDKYVPDEGQLKGIINGYLVSFERSQEADIVARGGESEGALWRRKNSDYQKNLGIQSSGFLEKLMSQWPCDSPVTPCDQNYRLLNSSNAMSKVWPKFGSWYRNKKFREHISEVQRVLDSINPVNSALQKYSFKPYRADTSQVPATVRLKDLLSRNAPDMPDSPVMAILPPANRSDLKLLLDGFKKAHSKDFENRYADSMLESLNALEKQTLSIETPIAPPSRPTLESFLTQNESHMEAALQIIQKTLAPLREVERLMRMVGLWPCISPASLLRQLATNSPTKLDAPWKLALVSYGKAITKLQRSERLMAYSKTGRESEFHSEAVNIGHQAWDPAEHPDWLLIEIENNFLVRPVQSRISSEMIKPTTGKNQTLQLNMGEGKSSVIVPIVSAALADGEKLVRVVVLKPLSTQMFQLLVQKLGGLAGRRIFYMPFSRAVKLDKTKATHIQRLYEECMQVRGILLVQPEHILSFKLIGLERLYEKDNELARVLLNSQHWLERNSRDILDECDELMGKNELIYTIGRQQSLENSPDRWMVVQELFDLVKRRTAAIIEEFPQGLEVETGFEVEKDKPGGFPVIRVLEPKAGEELLRQIASDILKGLLPTVSFRLFPKDISQLAFDFITDTKVSEKHVEPLLEYCRRDDIARASLLLLRGLIAENILFFALKEKRWRVDYGLAPNRIPRTQLAVPFRAKDIPAPRAEFGHPDVAITLTCLSYYYTGLSDSQLGDCFKILLQLSNPVVEYERWIQGLGNAVPETLRKLSGVDLLDTEERTNTIFPLFRFNKLVIDFYLSHLVFPKEAIEFPYKLSSSGWDIAVAKTHPTTGFSGTNDNRDLLPLSVTQHEMPEQLSTNAKVLSYLLQPENSYMCAKSTGPSGGRLRVDELLEMLIKQEPPIQVLLDVGAQVLGLQNHEVADHWLSRVPASKAQAVVFFNDNDELTVLSRDKNRESYEISAFAKQMDQCLVYLDEVHTRGTDLKLPTKSRAAVTLGPNLTKDTLVQACMRMRKLGHGQSVLFCAPPEIHQKILQVKQRSLVSSPAPLVTLKPPITVSDVLFWCMVGTCTTNRNNVPIWVKQGISYQRRDLASSDIQSSTIFPPLLREQEAQTLDERFGLQQLASNALFKHIPPELKGREKEIELIRDKCALFGVESLRGAHAQEEQEHELSHEAEREQQVERPPKEQPLTHWVHEDVLKFINTGIIAGNSTAFISAFGSLSETSAGNHHGSAWSPDLLVTKDFVETIKMNSDSQMDQFLRPVHWVVSASNGSKMVIMSPYEVNELIPRMRRSSTVNLHIYSPKVTKGMVPFFEDLASWTIPPVSPPPSGSLARELNIFAGQLYLKDHNTYQELCGFLGLYLGELPAGEVVRVHSDGFVEQGSRNDLNMKIHSPFSESPVAFLRTLIGFRRKGQDYLTTHLGQILHGRLLTEKDFDVNSLKF